MTSLEDFKNQVEETKPEILQEISGVLKILYPNISVNVINNIMIEKIAQMITTKWIRLENSSSTIIPNWYSLIFLKSGGGKDRLVNDIDNFILSEFIDYYQSQSKSIYEAQKASSANISSQIKAKARLLENSKGEENDTRNRNAF